ncbi:MAG: hypothetical protein K8L97_28265 [Anaerolineae bacterium]|nr:hypothetical protein [Anaerolineae bacterium]
MRKTFGILFVITALLLVGILPSVVFAQQATTTACPGAPAPRLTVGGTAQVAQFYSTLRADFDSNTILTILYRTDGDTFTVVSGPRCGIGPYNWWQVNYKGTLGWVTEGTGSTYWVEPTTVVTPAPSTPSATPTLAPIPVTPTPSQGACPGAPAPKLIIGGIARPAQVYTSLRSGLDSNTVLKVLYRANGDTFKVLNGPFCATGPHNWWQVDYKGTVGWVTEGIGTTYWVEPAAGL